MIVTHAPIAAHLALLIPLMTPRSYDEYGRLYRELRAIHNSASKEMAREYPSDEIEPTDPQYDSFLKRRMDFYQKTVDEELAKLSKGTKISVYELIDIKNEGDARGWFSDGGGTMPTRAEARENLEIKRRLEASAWNRRAKELLIRKRLDAKQAEKTKQLNIEKQIRRADTLIRQAEAMLRLGNIKSAKEYATKVLEIAPEGSDSRTQAEGILKRKK